MKNLPRKSVRLQPSLYWNFLLLLLLTLNFNLNAQTTCPAAESIEVSKITTTTARITYKLSGNISSATIEYGTTSSMGGDWKSVLISKTAKYWDLTNLTPATKYYFRIKSFCENSAVNITPVSSAIKDFTTYPVATCPVATNLSASEITTTSARINYSLSLNIGSATLEISSTNNSSLRTINLEVKSTYYDLKELSASTTYYYRIKTVCTNTPGVYSPVYTNNNTFNTTAIPVCLPTTNLSVRDITAVSARINYALPDALGSATFEIRPSTTTAYSLITLASNSAFTIRDGLTALTKYYVRIKTVCKNGGTNVAETTFTTLAAPVCAAASNVSISNVSAKGALISYKLPDGIKSATLEITSASNTTITSNTQTWKSITISNTSSSYQFTDLLPLTRYYARVKSICTNGSDNTSLVVYFTTLALPVCTAATDVTVTDISAVSAKINFILHGEVKSASLLIRPATSTAYLTIIIPIPSTNFVRKELTPQTKYFYKISTVCSDGTIVTTSEASFTTFATPSCVPATALSAGGISAVGAKIGYSLPKEISGATLEIIAANTASPTISTANWQPFKLTLGTTVYELQGLTPQTLYYFRIKTECTNGSTIYSEVFRFTTLAQPTCVAATDLKASNITSNSVRINFTLPKNINSAFLDIKTPNATSWSSYGITNFSSTYLDRGDLLPSTEYVYRIRTNCSASAATISPVYSLEGHFVTLATTLCTKATGLAVKDISFNSAIILYAIPAGTTSATIDIMMVANGTTPAGTTDWRSISIGLTSTSFTLRDLTPSTHYYVRITTLCTQGTKSSTDASGFITLASPVCAAATNVTVSNIYSASVRINFTLPLGIAGAAVEILSPGTISWLSYGITNLSSTYYDRKELSPMTRYYYRIKTICTNGSITYTTPGDFTTIAESACNQATNTVGNISATTAVITYSIPLNSSSAVLEINSSNYPNWQPITLALTSKSYELKQLYPATRYAFRIKTVCVNGTGTDHIIYSNEGNFTTLSASTCGAATNVKYSIVSNTNVHIYFTLPKNIIGASVEISTPNHTDVWTDLKITDLSSAYYNLEGLTAGTVYYFRIKTICADNPGSNSINYSPAATFTTSNNKDAVIGITVPTTQSPGDLSVSCYPNPASTDISITISGVSGELVDLKISNIYGLTVFQGKYSENTVQKIDVQSYPRGIYVIRVSQSGKTNSIKVALK